MEYIKALGIRYANELPTIHKKKDTPLQPIYEAFTLERAIFRNQIFIDKLTKGERK